MFWSSVRSLSVVVKGGDIDKTYAFNRVFEVHFKVS